MIDKGEKLSKISDTGKSRTKLLYIWICQYTHICEMHEIENQGGKHLKTSSSFHTCTLRERLTNGLSID